MALCYRISSSDIIIWRLANHVNIKGASLGASNQVTGSITDKELLNFTSISSIHEQWVCILEVYKRLAQEDKICWTYSLSKYQHALIEGCNSENDTLMQCNQHHQDDSIDNWSEGKSSWFQMLILWASCAENGLLYTIRPQTESYANRLYILLGVYWTPWHQ